MSPEDGKALVRRRFEELDRRNVSILDEMFTKDYVLNFPSAHRPLSLEQTKQLYEALYDAFPDLRHTIEDQIAEGDRVVTRWVARGTHRGELMGIEPTEREIEFGGINIYRLDGDKLTESHVTWDIRGLLQQLGAAPEKPVFPADLLRKA
jgi:steroid delta-isomerase-like uncharacterized protein